MAKTRKATKPAASRAEIHVSSKRRRDIALEATYQMAALFDELAKQTRRMDCADTMDESAVVKALLIRGRALASVAMNALGDGLPAASTAEAIGALEKVVTNGVPIEELE
jgi:division protein CdvB (Snf7/Vps24/ESCRT-III family)